MAAFGAGVRARLGPAIVDAHIRSGCRCAYSASAGSGARRTRRRGGEKKLRDGKTTPTRSPPSTTRGGEDRRPSSSSPSAVFGIYPQSPAERDIFRSVLESARMRHERGERALQRAVKRRNPKLYNRFMADAARAGCPSLVRQASDQMDKDGIEKNEYTASVLINALVRGGAPLDEARAVLEDFESRGVRTNEAALGPLLQGTIEPAGHDLGGGEGSESRSERAEMAIEMVGRQLDDGTDGAAAVPSRRALDVLLRGCKRWAPTLAPRVLRALVPPSSDGGERPILEPSTLALLTEIACIDVNPALASHLVHRMKEDWDVSADTSLWYEVATAHALKGDDVGIIRALQEADMAAAAAAAVEELDGGGSGSRRNLDRRPVPKSMLEARRGTLMEYLSSDQMRRGAVGGGEADSSCHLFYDSPMISWGEDMRGERNADKAGDKLTRSEEWLLRLLDCDASSADANGGALHVEVGSGSGDWLVARAASRPSDVYLGVEPRVDKVHQLWTRAVLRDLTNVHAFADVGEAVLGRVLLDGSVGTVHVRFPQPPLLELHQLLEDDVPSGGYLGGGSFLDCAVRALEPGGELRIVTDDPLYCVLMTATVRRYNEVADEAGAHRLLAKRGEGDGSGLMVSPAQPEAEDASFFDALLADAGRKERYTLMFEKE